MLRTVCFCVVFIGFLVGQGKFSSFFFLCCFLLYLLRFLNQTMKNKGFCRQRFVRKHMCRYRKNGIMTSIFLLFIRRKMLNSPNIGYESGKIIESSCILQQVHCSSEYRSQPSTKYLIIPYANNIEMALIKSMKQTY